MDQELIPPVLGENVGNFLYNVGVRRCFVNTTQNPDVTTKKTDNLNSLKIKYICMGNKKIMTKS